MQRLLDAQSLFVESGLYSKFDVRGELLDRIMNIMSGRTTLRARCVQCKEDSIFQSDAHPQVAARMNVPLGEKRITDKDRAVTSPIFKCALNPEHKIEFQLRLENGRLFKTGQFPPMIELMKTADNRYEAFLKEKYDDLQKADILYAQNFSIGAFTYVRRVFEYVVDQAEESARLDPNWISRDNGQLTSATPMSQRIGMLKDFLPQSIFERKEYYNFLSEGLHRLTEEQCAEHYRVAKAGIRVILDEKIAKEIKEKDEQLLVEALRQRKK